MYDNHPIVIIDDQHEYRTMVAKGFKSAGCSKEVIQFENGLIFLQFLSGIPRNEFPSIVMLNLDIPIKEDLNVLKEIKANPRFKHIPVIVYSDSPTIQFRGAAFSNGANCYLIKPNGLEHIVEILSSVALLWCLH